VDSDSTTAIVDSPTGQAEPKRKASEFEIPLGFALNFVSGRGLLSTRDRKFGPLDLKVLELEIPDIAFPFDVTGGSERFKTHRCALRHLVFGLDSEGIADVLKRTDLTQHGFVDLKAAMRDGSIEFAGRFSVGEHQADFTFRASLLIRSQEELHIVFYDARVYGWLPIPSGLLPEYLRRGLGLPYFDGQRAGGWIVRPAEQFLREILPRNGWKVPNTSYAKLVAAEIARGQLVIVAGPEGEPSLRQIAERAAPAAAVRAAEGVAAYSKAEEALGAGRIQDAYDRFREAIDDERGGPWARERLLQIGAADPELALETRQLAEEVLNHDPQDIQALLTLAAIAMRERSWGEATSRYEALAEIARSRKDRFDAVAAELAAAAAATPIDPGGALAAYERAAARARDSVIAHRALFELRNASGHWAGAAQAGERLIKLETDPARRGAVHRDLGHLYRSQVGDLKNARMHFERALRIAPDDPGALEGLAETYAARGEPARAASYLARLAEQAEASDDSARTVSLNLRLGEIWERWLGDVESATSRYYKVLDVDPRNRTARLRLAKLAEDRGEVARARALYEDVLAVEEERGDPEAIPDLVAAYTRLARVTLVAEGPTAEAIACLERAVELDPSNRSARDELGKVLRDRGEWSRLIRLLEETARVSARPEEVRRSRIAAARLELEQRNDTAAAQRNLELILDAQPDDAEALQLLVPILEHERDIVEIMARLEAAAGATTEPTRRAAYLLLLSKTRESMGTDADARRRDLEHALDANPYLLEAAEALLALAEEQRDPHGEARALDRLTVAAESSERRGRVLARRAEILWQLLDREQDAEKALRESVQVFPANVPAWTTLSKLMESRGDIEGSRRALQSAVVQAKRHGENMASLHLRLAELSRAVEDEQGEAEHLVEAGEAGLRTEALCERLVAVFSKAGRRAAASDLLEKWAAADRADLLWVRAAEVRRSLGELDRAVTIYRKIVEAHGDQAKGAAEAMEGVAKERGDLASAAEALRFQIEVASKDELPGLLARALRAQIDAQDDQAAEKTCVRLLEVDPFAAPAHRVMANLSEKRSDWQDALIHYYTLLFESPQAGQERYERRAAFERAAALAREFQSSGLVGLQRAFVEEFPETSEDALKRSLGDMLAAEGKWEALLELRRDQSKMATPEAAADLGREIGDILHHHLGRSEEAIPYYQGIVNSRPDDTDTRKALLEVYESLGRWVDLAVSLSALSQLTADAAIALDYGLRSVEVYAEKVGDDASAKAILRALNQVVAGSPEANARFGEALRRYELWPDLVRHLEQTIESDLNPDDPRFAELTQVIADEMNDPEAAIKWCARMNEARPESDTPRRMQIDLLLSHPDVGDPVVAFRDWAEAREGARRAAVFEELAEYLRTDGDEEGSLAVLGEAADADTSADRLQKQLVERHSARADWPSALVWLERLAFATEAVKTREERLRLFAEMATEHSDDPTIAAKALRAMHSRNEAETRQLAQLCANSGDVECIEELIGAVDAFDREATLAAGRALVDADRRVSAKPFLERAMDLGANVEAWDIATRAWRQDGRLGELGRWRLERSATAREEDRAWLQLLARAELIEAGEDVPDSEGDLEEQLASANLSQASSAWAVFCVAQSIQSTEWLDRAAVSLETMLSEEDPRILGVLRHRTQSEFASGDADAAIALSRRLIELGDTAAEIWLEKGLEAAGRTDELIEALRVRAERKPSDAATVWLRVATLLVNKESWVEAAAALVNVAEDERTSHWAELYFGCGVELEDPSIRAAGAEVAIECAEDDHSRAQWLRRRGHILWWELGEEAQARNLFAEAHLLEPEQANAVLAAAKTSVGAGDNKGAIRILAESLAVLEGSETAPLWLLRAQLKWQDKNYPQTIDSLVRATGLLGDDAVAWREAGDLAEAMEESELALQALQRAYELDAANEPAYIRALELANRYGELVDVLEARSDDLSGAEAGARLARAARIAVDRLDDKERALKLMDGATRQAPTLENMRTTYRLAEELDRPTILAALGPALFKRLDEQDSERERYLHSFVIALEHLGLVCDGREALDELYNRDAATPAEKQMLAELAADDDPVLAATLVDEAVRAAGGNDLPIGLFAATRAWLRAEKTDTARGVLLEALGIGLDTVEAHQLAMELFEGNDRLTSVARVIELGGDTDIEIGERVRLRMDLADFRLNQDNAAAAYELLKGAAELERPEGWVKKTERVLEALGDREEISAFWLQEIDSGVWDEQGQIQRLREARETFQASNNVVGELRCLQILTRRAPDDLDVQDRFVEISAQLGDKDQFISFVNNELAAADMPDQRARLALRYAPVLQERFDDPQAAVGILRSSHAEVPSASLAEALAEALTANAQAKQAIKVLLDQANQSDVQQQIALLRHAGTIAQSPAGDAETAFDVLRKVVELDTSIDEPREFCLAYAESHEKWHELIELLEVVAAGQSDAQAAHVCMIRAADAARDHLGDTVRELGLLKAAVDASPDESPAVTRLLCLLIDSGNTDGALGLLLGGNTTVEHELGLGNRLLSILRDARRDSDAQQVMEFLADRHPNSAVARELLLQRARRAGDNETVLGALLSKLSEPDDLKDRERFDLLVEAGQAALAIEQDQKALECFDLALAIEAQDLDVLFLVAQLATKLSVDVIYDKAVMCAVPLRQNARQRAEQLDGDERVVWLMLLGRAHEAAGDAEQAIIAYEGVAAAADDPPGKVVKALSFAYERKGDWKKLVELLEKRVTRVETEDERADTYYRMGVIWRDNLIDEERAGDCFASSLSAQSDHGPARLAQGLLQFERNQFEGALAHLASQVDVDDAATPLGYLLALSECYRQTKAFDEALMVAGRILERDPGRSDLIATRAEMFSAADRNDEAEQEWTRYLSAAESSVSANEVLQVRRKLAELALGRSDVTTAIQQLEGAVRAVPDSMETLVILRELYEKTGRWEEAADLRIREATAAPDVETSAEHYRTLAAIFLTRLNSSARAATMLERAVEATPGDSALLKQLLALYEERDDWRQFLVVGERLLALDDSKVDGAFFAKLARAYHDVAGDTDRAKEFFEKALVTEPENVDLRAGYAEFAKNVGDYATYVRVEERTIEFVDDVDERVGRYQELAEVCLQRTGDLQRAAASLFKARELRPDDMELLRNLANTYALDPKFYGQATELYRELLDVAPLDVQTLRILARLSGQVGDNDKAYGHYAALLVLLPGDDEARRFVEACRPAVPAGPQRPLTDADRMQGLLHPDQGGPLEDLFAPLARFAELTQPGVLDTLGVTERDKLAPTDSRLQYLTKVLEPLGMPKVSIYLWRGGGFGYRTELLGSPAILMGSTLATDATDRQRAFLIARAAELYRTGHTLAEKLSAPELGGVVAGLCLAVEPESSPAGGSVETPVWANTIAAPMTEAIRGRSKPKVQSYLSSYGEVDFSRWRWGSILTAGRIAMLVSCDVEEAVGAILRLRGMDDLADDQRAAVIQESPEAMDLMRFACSEDFFKLRQALGLALRQAKS